MSVKLPSGETVAGSLVRTDEFNVELRDSAGWHRSFHERNRYTLKRENKHDVECFRVHT